MLTDTVWLNIVFILTLYEPKSCTTHVSNASRPTGNVTFEMGALNFGSAEMREREIQKSENSLLNRLSIMTLFLIKFQ